MWVAVASVAIASKPLKVGVFSVGRVAVMYCTPLSLITAFEIVVAAPVTPVEIETVKCEADSGISTAQTWPGASAVRI